MGFILSYKLRKLFQFSLSLSSPYPIPQFPSSKHHHQLTPQSTNNSRAHALNACLLHHYDTLIPLHNIETNSPIPNFPTTSKQIAEMELIDLDQVLEELGFVLEDRKKTTCTRRLLRAVVGLVADFPGVKA